MNIKLTQYQVQTLGNRAAQTFAVRCNAYLDGIEPMVVLAVARAIACELGNLKHDPDNAGVNFGKLDSDGWIALAFKSETTIKETPGLRLAKLLQEVEKLNAKSFGKGFRFTIRHSEMLKADIEWIAKLRVVEIPAEKPVENQSATPVKQGVKEVA